MAFLKNYFRIIGFLVSALFLYLTFRNANIALVMQNLRFLNLLSISAAFALYFMFYVVRSLYQMNNLSTLKPDIRFSNSLAAIALSLFYNVIFPARLGEVVRTFFLSKRENLKKASVLSYIVVEKLIDFLFMLVLLLVLLLIGFSDVETREIALISSIVGIAVLSLVFIYVKFNRIALFIITAITPKKIHASIGRMNESALEGFRFYRSATQIARGILLMLLGWAVVAGVFWLVAASYVQLLKLPAYSALFFMVFSSISLAVPSAPAGVGVVHYGLYLAVRLLNKGSPLSSVDLVGAFTIVTHFFTGILMDVVIGGGIALFHRVHFGKTLADKKSMAAEDDGIPV